MKFLFNIKTFVKLITQYVNIFLDKEKKFFYCFFNAIFKCLQIKKE